MNSTFASETRTSPSLASHLTNISTQLNTYGKLSPIYLFINLFESLAVMVKLVLFFLTLCHPSVCLAKRLFQAALFGSNEKVLQYVL